MGHVAALDAGAPMPRTVGDKPMPRHLPVILAAGAFVAAVAVLAITPAFAAEPAGPLDVTCGDMIATLRVADPGPNPSPERQRQAVEAQDDVAIGLYWIHGYLVGTKGEAAPKLTRAWMQTEVVRLVEVCKAQSPDGRKSLVQVMQQ
jgi:hypothetical protein